LSISQSEASLLGSLSRLGGKADASSLAKDLKLPENSIFSLSGLLESKGYIRTAEIVSERIELTDEGRYCAMNGLPESRLMKALASSGGRIQLSDLGKILKPQEISVSLGWGRKTDAIQVERKGISPPMAVLLKNVPLELDNTLKKLESQPDMSSLSQNERDDAKVLIERGLAVLKERKSLLIEQVKEVQVEVAANVLTSDMIRTGEWRKVSLRPYDVTASPPSLKIGKKQPYLEFLEEVKEILFAMGFEETQGPYVESEFWNFDVLFQAQDHPARAVHDNFQVMGVSPKIEAPPELIENVKSAHENGGGTGSRGWEYEWDVEIAKRRILRTHTTAVSARSLSSRKNPPVKTFCLSKVFRPDLIDSRHMVEFAQLDGILGDNGINVRHLLGILTEFANQLGFGEIRFTPGYFPFTEPSIEAYVKHPKLGWIECLGSGLFRPEVLAPLGIKFPVIAWGIGIDRLAMIRLGVNDIRELHTTNLSSLRAWRL
jgi:phenylalanyl-tRNA synthetase alpha chain